MDKRNKRRAGIYFTDQNKPYISVTNILGIIDKSALRYWFGRQVFRAVLKDPGIGEQDALAAPYRRSKTAMSRGSLVHSVVESFKETGNLVKGVPEQYQGYTQAFGKWVRDFQPVIGENEKTIYNEKEGYAGTLDMLAVVKGGNLVLDIKTGKDIYPESFLQTSAYLHGDGIKAEGTGVVLLKENGTYKFELGEDEYETFLHAKALWEWRNRDMLNDINYYGDQK